MFDELVEIICNYVDVQPQMCTKNHVLWRIWALRHLIS